MPFFAKNLTQSSTLLFKGGFVELKPGQTVQVNERDARWGIFREAVQSGKVELYESSEPKEFEPNSHEVVFEAVKVIEEPVQGELIVGEVHVEPVMIAPMHANSFKVAMPEPEQVVEPVVSFEAAEMEAPEQTPESPPEEVAPPAEVKPIRKYTKKA